MVCSQMEGGKVSSTLSLTMGGQLLWKDNFIISFCIQLFCGEAKSKLSRKKTLLKIVPMERLFLWEDNSYERIKPMEG